MGYGLEVKCNKCGYSEQFNLGMGMRDWDKEVVIEYFRSKRAETILYSNANWTFQWKLAICDKCKKLMRVPVLYVFDDEKGKSKLIDYICECGEEIHQIIDIPEPVDKIYISCPQCESNLEVKENILWD